MAPERLNRRPPVESWTAAIYVQGVGTVKGAGVVISSTRILTCAHVLQNGATRYQEIEVAFPKANLGLGHRQRVVRVLPDSWDRNAQPDLVVLELDEPVPAQVGPARVRFPDGNDLYDLDWWAFGFPDGRRPGRDAGGTHGPYLGDGMVRLRRNSPDELARGFSGSGVWSYDYDAVIGLVVTTAVGDGQAVTLHYADLYLPELKLREGQPWELGDADEQTQAAWGWRLAYDDERGRHWSPRARGVTVDTDRGFHFQGRTRALTEIVDWLDRDKPDAAVLVVTGSPGVGKSAVLGRIVTTADRDIRAELPPDTAVRATVGSVHCAVHVKGKTAHEAVLEIARAASLALPGTPQGLVPVFAEWLALTSERTAIVIDALDEAASPADARLLVDTMLELVQTCGHHGLRVVIGTRRTDDGGDLLAAFDRYGRILDLDRAEYFEAADLIGYAQSVLQLVGAERPGNPYRDDVVAEPVARRIAELSGQNFLIAGLAARDHGLHDVVATDPQQLDFPPTIDAILARYVLRIPDIGPVPARLALTVLAHAESPGLPVALWRAGVRAIGGAVTDQQLATFAQTSAANFLIESGTEPTYRLFHQAFNDALLRAEPDGNDIECRLFEAYLAHGRDSGWDHAHPYLLRSLAAHAARAAGIDAILGDDEYLLRADLARLLRAADGRASSAAGRARVTLLARTPQSFAADPAERAAMFSVTQTMDQLDSAFAVPASAPYAAVWANTPPRRERAVLEGHTDGVYGVCAVPLRDRSLLASAGEDGTVRLWDPVTGQTERVLDGHRGRVRSLCAIVGAGATLIASAGDDGVIALWDADTGRCRHRLEGHADWIRALCVVEHEGRPHLASCGDDRTVRVWDPETGLLVRFIGDQHSWVTTVSPVGTAQGPGLAWGEYSGEITIGHLATESPQRTIDGHTSWVTALIPITYRQQNLIASGGYDGAVRIWDADSGKMVRELVRTGSPITGLAIIHDGDRLRLAAAGDGGILRLWGLDDDEASELTLEGHASWATAVCSVTVGGGRELLASASDDGTVRLWLPGTGELDTVLVSDRIGPVASLCALPTATPSVAAALSDGSVGVWDAATGSGPTRWPGHFGPVVAVCPITVDGRALLASAGTDSWIRLRDAVTGQAVKNLKTDHDGVSTMEPLVLGDAAMLVTGGDDRSVRLWNLAAGTVTRKFLGHGGWVRAIAVVPLPHGPLILSGSHDGTARVWDPHGSDAVRVLKGHYGAVTAVTSIPDGNRVLLVTGGADHVIRLWDLETGSVASTLSGHTGGVAALCPVQMGAETLLASAGTDRTVRLWDVQTGSLLRTIPVHSEAQSCRVVDGRLVVGLATGVVVLELRPRIRPSREVRHG